MSAMSEPKTKAAALKLLTKRYDHYRSLFLRGTPAQIRKAEQDLQAAVDQVKKFN